MSPRFTDAFRRRVAIHEAGHAIGAIKLGVRFTRVSIDFGSDEGPILLISRFDRSDADSFAVVCWCGGLAEDRLLGTDEPCGDCDDRQAAVDRLATVYRARELERALIRCRLLARSLVRRHTWEIGIVADALVERETLRPSDVRALLGPQHPLLVER